MARTPREGCELEFERWLNEITDAAAQMPGHLGSNLQPPAAQHHGEWVIVYQFESQALLDDWIRSPLRADLVSRGEELTEGPPTVQHLALASAETQVTAVASFTVSDGQWQAFREDYASVIASIETFDGFIGAQLFAPVAGVQDETVIVFSFRTRPHLDAWLDSDERRRQVELLEEHVDGERQINVIGGFGGWFGLGDSQVKTWKQAAVVLLALYPTVLVLNELIGLILPAEFPYLLRVLLGNISGVAVLSWILMPRLTSRLDPWLRS